MLRLCWLLLTSLATSASCVAQTPASPPASAPISQAHMATTTESAPHYVAAGQPKLVQRVEPKYPQRALRAGIEGAVTLRFLVDTQGRPLQLSVYQSSGDNDLDAAALAAVQQWRFEPLRDTNNSAKVSPLLQVTLVFKVE